MAGASSIRHDTTTAANALSWNLFFLDLSVLTRSNIISVDHPGAGDRPIHEDRLACDQILIHRAKIPAVARHRAVVAHHKKAVRRNFVLRHRPLVGILRRHEWL